MAEFQKVPSYRWGRTTNGVREVYYQGPAYLRLPRTVFAYVGFPTNTTGTVPGVVLVHGWGQAAFDHWVRYWNQRGYAALAMDLNGAGPDGPLPDGGPPLTHPAIFLNVTPINMKDAWTYHAVANVMLGYSLLASLPGVDTNRIAVHGISWGGYVTCIVAGVDDRPRAAAPVFGAGFLYEDSHWVPRFYLLLCESRDRWIELYDPSSYLPGVTCPILFANGITDPYFAPVGYLHSYEVAGGDKVLALRPVLPHGRIWTDPSGQTEVNVFIDHHLKGTPGLPRIRVEESTETELVCRVESEAPIVAVRFHYTLDLGPWYYRHWTSVEQTLEGGRFVAQIPTNRPIVFFASATVLADNGFEAYASTPPEWRWGPDSPTQTQITAVSYDNQQGLVVEGIKPFGQSIVLEGTQDFCAWLPFYTNLDLTTHFSHRLPAHSFPVPFYIRARLWELPR